MWTSIPVLTEAFFRWMPYINVLWALQIALNVVLFRQGRWQPATRWASMALDAAGIVIGYLLLVGPPIVAISAEALVATGVADAATAATLAPSLSKAHDGDRDRNDRAERGTGEGSYPPGAAPALTVRCVDAIPDLRPDTTDFPSDEEKERPG